MFGINSTSNAYVLQNLRQINNDLSMSQLRIGTGKKVNSASDNASVWATAQKIRSDQAAQDGIRSGITLAKGSADAAVSAIDTVVNLLYEIQELALEVVADDPGDYTAVTAQVTALKAQIVSTMAGAKFNSENWLTDADATKTITIGVADGATQTIAVAAVEQDDTADTYGVFAAIAAISDTTTAATLSTGVNTAVTALSAYQAKLSTFSDGLGYQQDFLTAIDAIRDDAVSGLVDADLTEESAKVTALQTQQSLAYQALSIGNSSASSILRLFQ